MMYVYIITNYTNSVLYTGVTNNLERRIYEHKNHSIEHSFSDKYNLCKLIWFEEFNTPEEAINAEKRIKGWIRVKKMEMIKKSNPELEEIKID